MSSPSLFSSPCLLIFIKTKSVVCIRLPTFLFNATSTYLLVISLSLSLSLSLYLLSLSRPSFKLIGSTGMAGFSCQHPPFLLESSVFLPNYPIVNMPTSSEEGDTNTMSSSCFPFSSPPPQPNFQESIPVVNDANVLHCVDNKVYVTERQKADSSSMVIDRDCSTDQATDQKKSNSVEKKRKSRDGSSCSSSAQSKDSNSTDDKGKKQKKCSRSLTEMEGKSKTDNKKSTKRKTNQQPPPTGYVHVRARRGEATDSHSLAERVRREKISKRLKLLQGLVPGCDKVPSKALMLDEIINYVQSLQHQVEFLSMKLASLTPLFCDHFGVNFHDLSVKSEKLGSLESPFPSVQQRIPSPSTTFADMITTTSNHALQDGSPVSLLGQMQNALFQDNGSLSWCLEDQRQRPINQCSFSNLCSFQ